MTGDFFFDHPSVPEPKRVELSSVEHAQAMEDVDRLRDWFDADDQEAQALAARLKRIFERAS